MAEPRERLVISESDLSAPAAAPPSNGTPTGEARAAAFPSATYPPSGAYQLAAQKKKKLGQMTPGEMLAEVRNQNTFVTSLIAAAAAGLVAWIIFELIQDDTPRHLVRAAALEFGVYTAVFAALYSAWDDLTGQLWERVPRSAGIGLLLGALGGAAAGAIAQDLYGHIVTNLFRSHGFDISVTDVRLDGARALGWGLLGVGIGAAAGAARQSWRKTVNGLVGGALGGAVGGFLFNFIGKATSSGTLSRFIAFGVAAVLIGAAIGLIEVARRQAWIKVIAGGMAGKEFILYHQSTNFGSSPKCEVTLIKDPAVGAYHFRVAEHPNGRRSLGVFQGCVATVNGVPVESHWLRARDVIGVGATQLQYHERAVPA